MKLQVFFLTFFLFIPFASALEYVHFIHNGKDRHEEGKLLAEDRRGIDLLARDGRAYHITRGNILSRRSDGAPFTPYTKPEVLDRLKIEFPPSEGYNFHDPAAHGFYIVVYTTSPAFAHWYGRLLQRLHEQYIVHWRKLGLELTAPEFPMVAVVFANEPQYRRYAEQEGSRVSQGQRAYYNKLTNRIVLHDISGVQAQQGGSRRATATDIQRFLSQPASYDNISSLIHEAAHQVGFNAGMHSRFAPNPIWVYEGLAVYHEVPDQRNRELGWSIGPHINPSRLQRFRTYMDLPHRESPVLKMIRDDKLFNSPETALDHYALAWAVTFFLVRTKPKEMAAYLKIQQGKTMHSEDSSEIRVKDFESCFGSDWDKFYRDFAAFMRRL